MPYVSIKEVATLAGVSIATVSPVLSFIAALGVARV
jgi:hypothetical protein